MTGDTAAVDPRATAAVPVGGLGPSHPWWLLRLMLTAACALAAAGVGVWTSASALLVILGVTAVITVIQPGSHAVSAFLALCALGVLAGTDGSITGWTALTVFGMHAVHVLAALAAVVPRSASVERAALRPSLDRFVLAQAAGQFLVLLAWLIAPA